MEIKYTEEELNNIDKALLIKMFLNLQNHMETLTGETRALNDKMQKLMEQLVLVIKNDQGNLKIVGCWVHCRRKFDVALKPFVKALFVYIKSNEKKAGTERLKRQ